MIKETDPLENVLNMSNASYIAMLASDTWMEIADPNRKEIGGYDVA